MPQRFGFTTPQAAPVDPLVAALLRGGQGPSRTNMEGLGRLAQTLSGALRERQLDVQGRQEQAEALSALLSSGGETIIPPEENLAAGPGSDIAAGFGVPTVESGPLQGPGFDVARDVISDQPRDLSQGVLGRIFGLGNAPSKAQLSLAEALINRGFANQDAQAQFGRQKALFDARTQAQLTAKQQPLTPEQFAQQQALRAAGKATTNVKVDTGTQEGAQAKAEGEGVGKFFAALFTDIQKAGSDAQSTRAKIRRARQLLSKTETGPFTGTRADLKRLANSLGFEGSDEDLAQVANVEALRSLANDFALEQVGRTKGAVSEAENRRFDQIVFNIGTTRRGNELILDLADKVAERNIKLAKMAREHRKQFKSLGSVNEQGQDFTDVRDAFIEQNPLFDEETEKRLAAEPTGAPTVNFATMNPAQLQQVDVSKLSGADLDAFLAAARAAAGGAVR